MLFFFPSCDFSISSNLAVVKFSYDGFNWSKFTLTDLKKKLASSYPPFLGGATFLSSTGDVEMTDDSFLAKTG